MCPTTDGTGGQEKLAPFQHASLLQGLLLPKTPPCSPLLYLLFLLSHTSGKNKIKKQSTLSSHTRVVKKRQKKKMLSVVRRWAGSARKNHAVRRQVVYLRLHGRRLLFFYSSVLVLEFVYRSIAI